MTEEWGDEEVGRRMTEITAEKVETGENCHSTSLALSMAQQNDLSLPMKVIRSPQVGTESATIIPKIYIEYYENFQAKEYQDFHSMGGRAGGARTKISTH